MTEDEHRRLTEIEDLVRRAQMSARLATALLPPERAVSGKNLADVREELAAGVQALRDALAGLETLRLETLQLETLQKEGSADDTGEHRQLGRRVPRRS